jgi:glycosyltransferase involved in cell wall biosynthesis
MPTNGDFIQRHAKAVSSLHKVSILHIISNKNVSTSKIEINTINNIHTCIGYIKHTSNPILKLFRFFKVYKRLLQQIDVFDVIHLNVLFPLGLFALHQKVFKKKPFIISEHWTGYLASQKTKSSLFQKIASKAITKNATYVCPVSTHLAASMQNRGLKGNYKPIPNVVDTQLFKPSAQKEKEFTIVHVSSLKNDHKNISGILKSAKELENEIPNCTWNFIGGAGEQYSKEILHLGFKANNINFIDHLSQKKLISYLQRAHVFVLNSNYENLPCVILEAFACGIPVISTNVGGINEYFPDGFGSIISKNKPQELSLKIKDIYNSPINKPNEMHDYAEENFGIKTIAKQFSELYYKSLNTNS